MIKNEHLERLALAAGAIVRDFNAEQTTAPLASQLDGEFLQVVLLAPIEAEAPKRQAITARGALFQLLLAASDVAELIGTDRDPEDLRKRLQRVEGCLHSAINVVERECNLDRNEIGGSYFARRSYVPEIWRDDTDAWRRG